MRPETPTAVDCVWDDANQCVRCGYQARRQNTHRHCPAANGPDHFTRVAHYSAAVSRWVLAGCPVRRPDEIERVLSICQGCDLFAGDTCTHKDCGCRVSTQSSAWSNKLAMGTERCPIGRWRAVPRGDERPVRVGFVLPGIHAGGVESWLVSLCRELRAAPELGVVPSLVASVAGTGPQREILRELAECCAVVSPARSAQGTVHGVRDAATACRMAADASDVLVTWGVVGLPGLLGDHRRDDLPIVGMSHGDASWWYSVDQWVRDEWLSVCSHWVGVSEKAIEAIPSTAKMSLANGVDLERVKPTRSRSDVRREVGLPLDARVVLYHARLSKEKRIGAAIRALVELPDDVWLWIVGDGSAEQRAAIERAAVLAGRSVVSPYRRDVGNLLAAADCAVCCSEGEGYCLSAVEALAAGVPLASTAVGVLPEISRALGYPCHAAIDAECRSGQVAAAIMRALGPEQRQRDGAIGEFVRREHSAAAMARRWAQSMCEIRHAQTSRQVVVASDVKNVARLTTSSESSK